MLNQKIEKSIKSNDTDDGSVFDVLSISNQSKFESSLTLYCLNRLTSFYDAIQGVIDIMIEQNQASSNSDLYNSLYLPYYNKLTTCQNEIDKRYLALVHGHMEQMEGTIDKPIYRPEIPGSMKRVVDERGQRSITHYKVIERLKDADLVECLLETGRTHQIRVHLSSLGHPIYGDTLYGYEEDSEIMPRQALHAYGLNFKSPKTKKELELRAELPNDIKTLLEKLRK